MNKQIKDEDLSVMSPTKAALLRLGRPSTRYLLYTIVLTIVLFIIWAKYARLDEITRAGGQVITSQKVQILQNLEGGILEELYVSEGQVVDKDQLLLRINNEAAGSQYRDYLLRSYENEAAIARLEARISGQDPIFSENLLSNAPEIVARQRQLLETERKQDQAELEVLLTQKNLRLYEMNEQMERQNQLKQSLALAEKQREMARPLVQAKSYSQMEFIGLEQKVQSLKGDIAALDSAIPRLNESAKEAENRHLMRQAEMENTARLEINRLQAELSSFKEILNTGTDRVTRTELRSNINGIIKKIHISTIGGVIKPAQDLVEIVPLDDNFIIEARVNPADIAFIYPGQKAIVKLSAYDFSIYGGLDAVVENISADTYEGKQGEIYYLARIRTNKNTLSYNSKELPIIPGMQAQVDILTGTKSILDYLLKPILKSKQSALTER